MPGGATVSIELGEDELLGAHLLATMEGVPDDDAAGFAEVLRFTLERGLTERVTAAGLSWPPTAAAFDVAESIGKEVTGTKVDEAEKADNRAVLRSVGIGAIAVVAAVIIGCGYAFKWSWTGFTSNGQLWDWLHLLLLPIAFGLFPLWLKFSEYMSPARRRALGAAVLAFAVFVAIGYLAPVGWTGFKGQTLWNWLTLIVLPITIMTVQAWPTAGREVHRGHIAAGAIVSVALTVTIIGGYSGNWTWTGYQGNTLWDWMSLALAPIAVSTFVIPALVKLVSGRADESAAQKKADAGREQALQVARERAQVVA
jgi:hypothetical protein